MRIRGPGVGTQGTGSSADPLAPDLFSSGVVERVFRDLAWDPRAEDLDLDRRADCGARRHVRVRDRLLDRVAVSAAGDSPRYLAVDAHRFRAERHRARVVEHEARELCLGRGLALLQKRGAPDELALVELDAEPKPGLVGV